MKLRLKPVNQQVVGITALVQMAGSVEVNLIVMDTLLIEQDGIPDSGRCSVIDPKSAEIELPLANAMHQLDA